MRNILLTALAVVLVVVLLVVLLLPHGKKGGPPSMQFAALYQEACGPVSPDSLGAPWPDDDLLRAIRDEWHALGFRDSTIFEELAREWIYAASRTPTRLTNVAQTPTGRNLPFADRLVLGEQLLRHPRWRLGTIRWFPALAAVLSSTEKGVLASLASHDPRGETAREVAADLALPPDEVTGALTDLASVGWALTQGTGDSTVYRLADPAIRNGNALQFVHRSATGDRDRDFVSVDAAFADTRTLTEGTVTLWGPCVETGAIVRMFLVEGKLRRGRPGNAWAAVIQPPGLSDGLFASDRAFTAWRERHPEARVTFSGSVVALYRRMVQGQMEK